MTATCTDDFHMGVNSHRSNNTKRTFRILINNVGYRSRDGSRPLRRSFRIPALNCSSPFIPTEDKGAVIKLKEDKKKISVNDFYKERIAWNSCF